MRLFTANLDGIYIDIPYSFIAEIYPQIVQYALKKHPHLINTDWIKFENAEKNKMFYAAKSTVDKLRSLVGAGEHKNNYNATKIFHILRNLYDMNRGKSFRIPKMLLPNPYYNDGIDEFLEAMEIKRPLH